MAEPANTPAEPKPSTQCGDGLVWDPETQECVPKADANVAGAAAAGAAEKGMFAAVKAVMNDALEEMRKEIMASAKNIMKEELEKIQKEFAVGLRKELGLTTDPTVTKTELESAIRKAVLDLKPSGGKKTPAGEPLQKSTETKEKPSAVFANYGVN
jgi:hypothetical protein